MGEIMASSSSSRHLQHTPNSLDHELGHEDTAPRDRGDGEEME